MHPRKLSHEQYHERPQEVAVLPSLGARAVLRGQVVTRGWFISLTTDDDEPIASEGPFYLRLGDVLPYLTMDRSGETWAKKLDGAVVQGGFISVRVTVIWVCFDLGLTWCSATTYTAQSTNSCLLELPSGFHIRNIMGERPRREYMHFRLIGVHP